MFEEKRPQSDTKNDTARYLQTQKYYFYYYYYKLYTEYKRERESERAINICKNKKNNQQITTSNMSYNQ